MLDLKFIRENQDLVKQSLKDRNLGLNLDSLMALDASRREKLSELEALRSERNKANDEISRLLKEKQDALPRIASMKEISQRIDSLESQVRDIEAELDKQVLNIPNVPHASIPRGDASCNKIVRSWGERAQFDFKPLTHIEISQRLDIIDLNRAAKITGSNFILFKGWGARLERALINFMLDLHTKNTVTQRYFLPFW